MGLWYRIFGRSEAEVAPDVVSARIAAAGVRAECIFTPEGNGWQRAEISFAASAPIHLERFRSEEEGIRAELNSWAAFLETCDYDPIHTSLMERVVQSKQLFTVRKPFDC